jgi:hypothetical protein
MMDELVASPTEPTPKDKRLLQLAKMWDGLASIETADTPTTHDWSVCSDAVNLFEALVKMGSIRLCDGSVAEVQDSRGLIMDAITALDMAGRRNMAGRNIRLDASGIQAVRSVLEDYADILEEIPHRTMIRCHRITERRLHEILDGKSQPHDVKISTRKQTCTKN